jgi:hypothetical protein
MWKTLLKKRASVLKKAPQALAGTQMICGMNCVRNGIMSPGEHIEAAENSIKAADSMDDATCALAEAEIAQAHLLAAAVKIAYQLLSKKKRPADMVGVGLSLLKLAT